MPSAIKTESVRPRPRCRLIGTEARLVEGGRTEVHRCPVEGDRRPFQFVIRGPNHQSSVQLGLHGRAVHATVSGDEACELDMELDVEGEGGVVLDAWGVYAARQASMLLVIPGEADRVARVCRVFAAGTEVLALAEGRYVVRTIVSQGSMMFRLSLREDPVPPGAVRSPGSG